MQVVALLCISSFNYVYFNTFIESNGKLFLTIKKITSIMFVSILIIFQRKEESMDRRDTVGYEIRTFNNLFRRYIDRSQTKRYVDKITGMHSWIMGYLKDNIGRDVFQKDIEEEFEIKGSTVTKILQSMEANGFITRESIKQDARVKKIILTPKAVSLTKRIEQDIEDCEKKITYNISKEEMEKFFSTINKLKRNIELEVKND